MRKSSPRLLLALGGSALLVHPAVAEVTFGLESCRAIEEPSARLACYDRLATAETAAADSAAPGGPSGPAVAATTAPAPVSASAPSAEDLFGRNPVASEALVRQSAGIEQLDELRQPLAAVATEPDGRLLLTLANGQVWRQVDQPAPRLAPGAEVRIRRAAFGSYLLTAPGTTRGVRVRRLR